MAWLALALGRPGRWLVIFPTPALDSRGHWVHNVLSIDVTQQPDCSYRHQASWPELSKGQPLGSVKPDPVRAAARVARSKDPDPAHRWLIITATPGVRDGRIGTAAKPSCELFLLSILMVCPAVASTAACPAVLQTCAGVNPPSSY